MGRIVIDNSEIFGRLGLDSPTMTQTALVESAVNGAEGAIKKFLRYDPVYGTRTEYYPRADSSLPANSGYWDVNNSQAFYVELDGISGTLQLQHLPIRSITSLRVNSDGRNGTQVDSFTSDHDKTEGEDFWANYEQEDSSGNKVCSDGVLHSIGLWNTSPGSVKIVYIAGYTASEFVGNDSVLDASPIYESVIEEATRRIKSALLEGQTVGGGIGSGGSFVAGNIQSERLGDYSYSMGSSIGMRGSTSDRMYGGIYSILPSTREKLNGFVNWAFVD